MGKYNNLLIKFMTEKNRIVKQATGLLVATKPDMDELRSWPEDACADILSGLKDSSDERSCPWCITDLIRGCLSCSYSERNGECGTPRSRYSRIMRRIYKRTSQGYISDLTEMSELISNTRKKFRSIRVDKSDTHNTPKPPPKV